MSEQHRLPARVQPQVWVNDNAVDAGASISFDAHEAMLALRPQEFSRAAEQILGVGHDYDELALKSGVIDQWLGGGKDNTFVVSVEDHDFEEWLEGVGLSREQALEMDEDMIEALRARAASSEQAVSVKL